MITLTTSLSMFWYMTGPTGGSGLSTTVTTRVPESFPNSFSRVTTYLPVSSLLELSMSKTTSSVGL